MIKAAYKEVEAARDNQNRIWESYGEYARSIHRHAMPLWNLRWSRACKRMEAAESAYRAAHMMQVAV